MCIYIYTYIHTYIHNIPRTLYGDFIISSPAILSEIHTTNSNPNYNFTPLARCVKL